MSAEHFDIRQPHCLLGFLDNDIELGLRDVDFDMGARKTVLLVGWPFLAGSDGQLHARIRISAKNKLGCEACTEVVLGRKGHSRDALENRALHSRLVTANDNLWKVDISADSLGTKGVMLEGAIILQKFPTYRYPCITSPKTTYFKKES